MDVRNERHLHRPTPRTGDDDDENDDNDDTDNGNGRDDEEDDDDDFFLDGEERYSHISSDNDKDV